jgi:hypothetical protein
MIEHSEHRMTLRREPARMVADPLVTARVAELADVPFVVSCLAEAFGVSSEPLGDDELEALAGKFPGTLVVDYANEPVGTIRMDRRGGRDRARGVLCQRRGASPLSELRLRRHGNRGLLRRVLGTPVEALTWPSCAIEPLEEPASRSVSIASAP